MMNNEMWEEIQMVRQRVSVTLPKECVQWLNTKIKARLYANRSHAIEVLILDKMKDEAETRREMVS